MGIAGQQFHEINSSVNFCCGDLWQDLFLFGYLKTSSWIPGEMLIVPRQSKAWKFFFTHEVHEIRTWEEEMKGAGMFSPLYWESLTILSMLLL